MRLEAKTYHIWDTVKIPFLNAPWHALMLTLHRVLRGLTPAATVLVTARFVDTALAVFHQTAEQSELVTPVLLFAQLLTYNYLTAGAISLVETRFSMRLSEALKSAVIDKRARLAFCHLENNDDWELIHRTGKDPAGRIQGAFNALLSFMGMAVQIGSLLAIIMAQVWWAGLAILAFSVPLFMLAAKAGKAIYQANKQAEKFNRRAGYLSNILQSRDTAEERTLFSYTGHVNRIWHEKYEIARKINLKITAKMFVRTHGASLVTVLLDLCIVAVLIPPLAGGALSVGLFMGLVTAAFDLVQMMSWQLSYVMRELAHAREYLKDLTAFAALSETEGAEALPAEMEGFALGEIEFQDVSFAYPGTERMILQNCSFLLAGGRHYAFVGENGAGKTTVTKLLTGLYDNYEGTIRINGKDLRDFTQAEKKRLFSVVFQDFARYQLTLGENVWLGNVLEEDTKRLEKALADMELSDDAAGLPQGADTRLGKIYEDGSDLSGGQWQKVAIARTLYGKGAMLILDEPTAALDPMAESRVYALFGAVSKGKTALFITHRLGAARLADEILVISEGRVSEKGSHDELVAQNGLYAQMFESQKGWYAA